MSASWISSSLVVLQVSVSSSWRLAQSANTETMPMIVARTMMMIGSARRPVFSLRSPSLIGAPYLGRPRVWSRNSFSRSRSSVGRRMK